MLRVCAVFVCAAALLPAASALSCYQCSDVAGSDVEHPLLRSVNSAFVPKCTDFDPDNDSFKVAECVAPFQTTCSKAIIGDQVVRGCFDDSQMEEGCKSTEDDKFTICVCKSDFCNGSGTLAVSGMLLLVPAALAARLHLF